MMPTALHLIGPFHINGFNIANAIGIGLCLWLTSRDVAAHGLLSRTATSNLLIQATIVGILGGRLLGILDSWHGFNSWIDVLNLSNGGLSSSGALLGAAGYLLYALRARQVPLRAFCDIAAQYIPLMHAFGRLGCFAVGCCFGIPCFAPWAVTFTNLAGCAPCGTPLHPVQLYSAFFFFCFFGFMHIVSHWRSPPGTLFATYIIASNLERAVLDFWRGDRIFVQSSWGSISLYQLIALGIAVVGLIGLGILLTAHRKTAKHA